MKFCFKIYEKFLFKENSHAKLFGLGFNRVFKEYTVYKHIKQLVLKCFHIFSHWKIINETIFDLHAECNIIPKW